MDDVTALLVKRNREIAEVRDELVKVAAQNTVLQSQASVLLERSSNMDTELSREQGLCGGEQ